MVSIYLKHIHLYRLIFSLLILVPILASDLALQTKKVTKNILVFCFPGGKSHNFVFRELFSFTQRRLALENPEKEYKFHIIVHNFDKNLWTDSPHEIYGYGDVKSYEEQFYKAMENAKEDPVLGYNNFNKAMIHLYHDFMKDGLLEKLKGRDYDLILSDITNFLSIFLKRELKIEKQMYFNPTCIYIWINDVFEYNASYHPLIGSTFTEVMSFKERLINQVFLLGTRFSYLYFRSVQNAVFREYGYNYEMNPFPKDALYLNQCVDGLHYSISLPPNIISSGAVLPKPSQPLKDGKLNNFLDKFEKNIYVSQGTITKAMRLEVLKEVFQSFPNVGFILSLRIEFHSEWKEVPKNVLLSSWLPQNDLLGDKRVHAFITHGGLNSILESVYHAKPMIVIGTSIDQVNGAVVVEYRNIGIAITSDRDITKEKLIQSIKEIITEGKYTKNAQQIMQYIREKDGKETFYYWINYVIEHGYQHLLLPSMQEYNIIQLYNVDVWAVWLVLFFFFYKLFTYSFLSLINYFFKGNIKLKSS